MTPDLDIYVENFSNLNQDIISIHLAGARGEVPAELVGANLYEFDEFSPEELAQIEREGRGLAEYERARLGAR